ncbi:MAG: SRPBCC family protein [Leptolyngbya sp. RL_3_1]|nr:SRPBCC family protein [Leptolyngbya sp. RL_3_1]
MATTRIFEQAITIAARATTVERCITARSLMHQWLNPALRCEPFETDWDTALGGKSRFILNLPLIEPTLISTVIERQPGLIVWGFDGFFEGCDRWQCQPTDTGTQLLNRFEFTIPNPLVAFGFDAVAARWTKRDMEAQLQRLKQVAEREEILKG